METIALVFSILAFFFAFLTFLGLIGMAGYLFVVRPNPTTINVAAASGDQVEVYAAEEAEEFGDDGDDEPSEGETFGEDDPNWWKKKK